MPRPRKKRIATKETMIMHTKNPGHECKIEWTIDNVLQFPHETFTSKINLGRGCKTHLNLIIRIKEREDYTDFSIGYERTDQKKTAIRVIFDLQLLSSKGDVYVKKNFSSTSENAHKFLRFMNIKFADPDYFLSASKLTEADLPQPEDDDVLKNLVALGLVVWDVESVHKLYSLPGASILIKGSVKVFACCVPLRANPIKQSTTELLPTEIQRTELIDDLEGALQSGQFTDISLIVQGEVVKAHKFILSARSPVFRRLFQADVTGNQVIEMNLPNMDKSVLQFFLHYLYTGIVGAVKWDMVEHLYEAAKEYEVESLKGHCRRLLVSSLTDRRACRALIFAKKHKDTDLKNSTVDFLKNIFFRYKETAYWKSFRESYPELASEVMKAVVDDFT